MSTKKHLSTKTQFKEAINYIKESSNYIYASIGVFIASALIGLVFKENLAFIDKLIEKLIAQTMGLNTPEMIFFILQNNLLSSVLSILLGIFLGLFPLFSSITNGIVLGYVLGKTLEVAGILSWWRLLPHGIFELPAIFISFGLGIKLGSGFINNYIKHYWKKRKILVLLPLIITLFFAIIDLFLINPLYQQIPLPITNILLVPFAFILNLFLYFALFIIITYISNIKLRIIQNKHFKYNFYNSFNVLLMIIIPLLIIAAIIEGIAIGLFG